MKKIKKPKWKKFSRRQIYEAEAFAAKGGIAVHLMGDATEWLDNTKSKQTLRNFKGQDFAHLFGPDKETLIRAAKSIGCKPEWIQHPDNPKRMHFDITRSCLRKALEKCNETKA